MRIKRLEIQGFKSFAEKTVLHFGDGITGVVGPNGCGKSNIVDALRWALGEQSAKHLRGSDMEDVIFAGSESRGPMGLAEVTITFKNDGTLVPPEYKDLSEISVSRRLFRDGTSEYLINKNLCRLRDVLDLFLGTGIGTKAYSIIEQGRIGLIVTAKPEDRRSLIEDAAGVTKYKARRKTAERRLEATEQNLLRVSDITGELKKRCESLERQAKKAERYKRLKAELKELELHAAVHRHLELDALERLEEGRAETARRTIESAEQAIDTEEAALREATAAHDEAERELRGKEERLHEIEQAHAVGDKNLEHLERQLAGLEERRSEAEREKTSLGAQLEEAVKEEAELLLHGAALDVTSDAEVEELGAKERALMEIDTAIALREAQIDRDKHVIVDCRTEIARHESELANLERKRVDARVRAERLEIERTAAEVERESAEKLLREARQRLDESRQLRLNLEDRRVAQEGLLEGLTGEFVQNEAQLLALREELMDKRSRLSSLIEIQRNYEGCQAGVRAIMRHSSENPSWYKRLHGLVADVLSSAPKFESAVEAVLGERLQYVIVNDHNEGLASIEFLKKRTHGRSSFIPLSDLREERASWAPRKSSRPPTKSGSGGPAAQAAQAAAQSAAPTASPEGGLSMQPAVVVKGTEEPRTETGKKKKKKSSISDRPPPAEIEQAAREAQAKLVAGGAGDLVPKSAVPRGALGGSLALPVPELVDELDAEDIWPDLTAPGVCGKLVDLVGAQAGYENLARVLLGDVVVVEDIDAARRLWASSEHRKILVTLSGDVLDPTGILTGGSNQGVSAGLLAKKREIKELETAVRALEGRVAEVEEQSKRLREKIDAAEKAIATLSEEGHQEELSFVKLEKDVRVLEETTARHAERVKIIARELEQIEEERRGIEADVARSGSAVAELLEQRAELERRLEGAYVELGGEREGARQLRERVTELKIAVAASSERKNSSKRNLARIALRIEDLKARLFRLSSNIEASLEETAGVTQRISDARRDKHSLAEEAQTRREELVGLREAFDAAILRLREADTSIREQRRALELTKDELSTALVSLREHQMNRAALHEAIDTRYQLALIEVIPDYHLLAPQGPEAVERRTELKRQIDHMGEINLTAIEEYKEVKERYEFLTVQQKDLNAAIVSLKAAIKKINKTSEERFLETFKLVSEKFELVFPRLFKGGRASLVITDESDPLESGIELLVQPPGKKLQSMSLLSGGEKALTAVALIFSIFLIKPTPFCLLDEVDAPLDDANVGRYNDMVKDMSSISQFILITHNKRTMEIVDRMYGVTMEEPGISKIVGVDLKSDGGHLKLAG